MRYMYIFRERKRERCKTGTENQHFRYAFVGSYNHDIISVMISVQKITDLLLVIEFRK